MSHIRWRKYVPAWRQSDWYLALSAPAPCAQVLFDYLATGTQTTALPGLLRTGVATLQEECGWSAHPAAAVRAALDELVAQGVVFFDAARRVLWCPRIFTEPENPPTVRSWRTAWAEIPDCPLKRDAWEFFHAYFSSLILPRSCRAHSLPDCRVCPEDHFRAHPDSKPGFLAVFEQSCARPASEPSRPVTSLEISQVTYQPIPMGTSPASTQVTYRPSTKVTSTGSPLQEQKLELEPEQKQKPEQKQDTQGVLPQRARAIYEEPAPQQVPTAPHEVPGAVVPAPAEGPRPAVPPTARQASEVPPPPPTLTALEALGMLKLASGDKLQLGQVTPQTPQTPGLELGVPNMGLLGDWTRVYTGARATREVIAAAGAYLAAGLHWADKGQGGVTLHLLTQKQHWDELLTKAKEWDRLGRPVKQTRAGGHMQPTAQPLQRNPTREELLQKVGV